MTERQLFVLGEVSCGLHTARTVFGSEHVRLSLPVIVKCLDELEDMGMVRWVVAEPNEPAGPPVDRVYETTAQGERALDHHLGTYRRRT